MITLRDGSFSLSQLLVGESRGYLLLAFRFTLRYMTSKNCDLILKGQTFSRLSERGRYFEGIYILLFDRGWRKLNGLKTPPPSVQLTDSIQEVDAENKRFVFNAVIKW